MAHNCECKHCLLEDANANLKSRLAAAQLRLTERTAQWQSSFEDIRKLQFLLQRYGRHDRKCHGTCVCGFAEVQIRGMKEP